MTAKISIFDVDRTLTRRPTYSAFLLFGALRSAPWRLALVPMLIPYAIAYAAKRISRKRMKEAMHRVALGKRLDSRRVTALADRFASRLFKSGVYPRAFETIEADRREGRRIVLATAAPEFYITPFAGLLGIDDVVATGASWDDGQLTPEIAGENCYGAAKLVMIADWLDRQGIARENAHIRFYSDHASDRPTFEWADEPVMVNASPKLLDIGRGRGWPSRDWRSAQPSASQPD